MSHPSRALYINSINMNSDEELAQFVTGYKSLERYLGETHQFPIRIENQEQRKGRHSYHTVYQIPDNGGVTMLTTVEQYFTELLLAKPVLHALGLEPSPVPKGHDPNSLPDFNLAGTWVLEDPRKKRIIPVVESFHLLVRSPRTKTLDRIMGKAEELFGRK